MDPKDRDPRDDARRSFDESEETPTHLVPTPRKHETPTLEGLAEQVHALRGDLDAALSRWADQGKEVGSLRALYAELKEQFEERAWLLDAVKRLVNYLDTWAREIISRQKARDQSKPPATRSGTIPPRTEPK